MFQERDNLWPRPLPPNGCAIRGLTPTKAIITAVAKRCFPPRDTALAYLQTTRNILIRGSSRRHKNSFRPQRYLRAKAGIFSFSQILSLLDNLIVFTKIYHCGRRFLLIQMDRGADLFLGPCYLHHREQDDPVQVFVKLLLLNPDELDVALSLPAVLFPMHA